MQVRHRRCSMNGDIRDERISIGFRDSAVFNTLPAGLPINPRTSRFHPPIVYIIPQGEYAVQMRNFTDSWAWLTAVRVSTSFSYSRAGAVTNQTDHLSGEP
jgi:hypothetical protein